MATTSYVQSDVICLTVSTMSAAVIDGPDGALRSTVSLLTSTLTLVPPTSIDRIFIVPLIPDRASHRGPSSGDQPRPGPRCLSGTRGRASRCPELDRQSPR